MIFALLFSYLEYLLTSSLVKLLILLFLSSLCFFLNFMVKKNLVRFKAESNALDILKSRNAI